MDTPHAVLQTLQTAEDDHADLAAVGSRQSKSEARVGRKQMNRSRPFMVLAPDCGRSSCRRAEGEGPFQRYQAQLPASSAARPAWPLASCSRHRCLGHLQEPGAGVYTDADEELA